MNKIQSTAGQGVRTRGRSRRSATMIIGLLTVSFLSSVVQRSLAMTFDEMIAKYDTLETIAGVALVEPDGVNSWDPSMEGQPAIEVELSRPHMAMADWEGNVYIADKDGHAIRRVTPDGTIHTIAGSGENGFNGDGAALDVMLSQPNGLYTFPNGTTYILDTGNNRVRRLGLDGQLETVFEDPAGIAVGRGLWVSPDESTVFYSAGTEVRRWTVEKGIEIYAGGFAELGNLDIDPSDGNLVVTDRGDHGVFKVYDDGDSELIAGDLSTGGGGTGRPALRTGLEEVRGVAFHPDGGYFLATHRGGQIWYVDPQGIIYLTIDGDNDGAHSGDGLPLTSPGKKISENRAVTIAPNGDMLITEHDGGFIRRVRTNVPFSPGDFDRDRDLDAEDIDRLNQSIRTGAHEQTMDVDLDGFVTSNDRAVWIARLRKTYVGDANMDGGFNTSDLVFVFQRGEYEDQVAANSTWADGDWDGDTEFNSADIVYAFSDSGACYENQCQGPRGAVGVPESVSLGLVGVAGLMIVRFRHARRARDGQVRVAR